MIASRYHSRDVVALRYIGEAMNVEKQNTERFFVRLPADAKLWVVKQAKKNGSSQNSEIIRAIRERMDRQAAGQTA